MDGGSTAAIAVTRELADFVVASRFDALPGAIHAEGKRAFVNWMGGALGGAHHPSVDKVAAVLAPVSGAGEAQVIGRDLRVDAMLAALLNSMSASAHVYDDTHPSSVAHPTSPVAAATLALAERTGANGRDTLHAMILGIEVMCRVSNILMAPPATSALGLFMTGLTGGIGGAVAGAKLLGLDAQKTAWAIGSAAAQAAGIRVVHGSDATPLMPGVAARAGVTSALLAAAGFTANESSIEGAKGFADVFARSANLGIAVEGLGQRFELATLTYKPYPCGIVAHPAIDACLDLARRPGFDAAAIRQLDLKVNPVTLTLTGLRRPKTGMQSHNSVYHWAAAALLRGKAGIAEESDEAVADPVIIALAERVVAEADTGMAMDQCTATLHMWDGSTLETRIEHCRGSMARPMTDDELDKKFRAQALHVLDEAGSGRVLQLIRAIETLEDIRDLTRLCVPAARRLS
jgi:2-methylcitrate dehydratase PrpD